ncbi:MAG TPA: DUF2269 family protein [Solirubrobacteraceae bacterium]
MTFYELLKTIHVLAMATWFGSAVAINVIGVRALRGEDGAAFPSFGMNAGWWASKAHPAAGVVLLITGFAMVGDHDLSIGDPWISIAIAGLVIAMGIGGALIGRASGQLTAALQQSRGTMTEQTQRLGEQVLRYSQFEILVLVIVIADMVFKPGS